MKKYSIALLLVPLFASTVIMISEAKASFDHEKGNKQAEERDLETEINQETDAFPDIITFTSSFYQ